MIDGLFGSLFGGASAPSAMGNMRLTDFQSALANRESFAGANNLFMAQPMRELPAGIFWAKTGGKTHRVVIRRTPEVVIDLSGLGA